MKKNLLCFIGSIIGLLSLFFYNKPINDDIPAILRTLFYGNSSVSILHPFWLILLLSLLSIVYGFGLSIYGIVKNKDIATSVFFVSLINILNIYALFFLTKKITLYGGMLLICLVLFIVLAFANFIVNNIKKGEKDKQKMED